MERKPTLLIGTRNKAATQKIEAIVSPLFEVTARAFTGVEVVDLTRALKPQLILMDYVFKDFEGVEVLRALRSENNLVPVVFFSRCEFRDSMRECFSLGMSYYLTAPVSGYQIKSALLSAL